MTIRSSDSDRSHSSKGSKRDNMSLADKTSLAYTTDIASLRNEPLGGSATANGNGLYQAIAHGSQTLSMSSEPPRGMVSLPGGPEALQRGIDSMPASLSASRQSFRMAMGNTSNEFFVDVM